MGERNGGRKCGTVESKTGYKREYFCGKYRCKKLLITDLKVFRLERSGREKVKAYFIFNDTQMADLIEKNPTNKEELGQVSAFVPVKAEKYGEEMIMVYGEILRLGGEKYDYYKKFSTRTS